MYTGFVVVDSTAGQVDYGSMWYEETPIPQLILSFNVKSTFKK